MKAETENSGFHLATFFVKENKFLLKLIKMDLERFGTKLYVCVCVCVFVLLYLWGPDVPTRIVKPDIFDFVRTFGRSSQGK